VVVGVEHHSLAAPQLQHRRAGVGDRDLTALAHAEDPRQLGVPDRR
jgi:hypothetical protein